MSPESSKEPIRELTVPLHRVPFLLKQYIPDIVIRFQENLDDKEHLKT